MDDLPASHFGCILVDPPWAFSTYSGDSVPQRAEEQHYPTMPFDELAALPVDRVAAKDAALFMWVIGSHIPQAIALADAWGFTFRTDAIYWLKQKLVDAGQVDMLTGDIAELPPGLGHWTRKQVEPCFLFTRGKPRRIGKGVRQTIVEPRRQHSRKPDCQYGMIEQLVAGPYLEMFARQTRPGWAAWGNQTDKFEPVTEAYRLPAGEAAA